MWESLTDQVDSKLQVYRKYISAAKKDWIEFVSAGIYNSGKHRKENFFLKDPWPKLRTKIYLIIGGNNRLGGIWARMKEKTMYTMFLGHLY